MQGGESANAMRRLNTMNWMKRYRYKKEGDPNTDMRNVMLIVSALIAAVTFQAGVNPPGGVWQDSSNGHTPGSAIYSDRTVPFYVFLIFNTLALSSSIFVIISLTFKFPFSVELWIGTLSMIITYGSSVFAITPHHRAYKFRYLLASAALPPIIRVIVEACRFVKRKCYD